MYNECVLIDSAACIVSLLEKFDFEKSPKFLQVPFSVTAKTLSGKFVTVLTGVKAKTSW